MKTLDISNFEQHSAGKLYPGFIQIVSGKDGFRLNYSRVPMAQLPPPTGQRIFLTHEEAFSSIFTDLAKLKKVPNSTNISYINEVSNGKTLRQLPTNFTLF